MLINNENILAQGIDWMCGVYICTQQQATCWHNVTEVVQATFIPLLMSRLLGDSLSSLHPELAVLWI